MAGVLVFVFLVLCVRVAEFTDPCIIELECAECLPDNMPLVRVTPRGAQGAGAAGEGEGGGAVRAAHGDEVTLECAGGRFLAYPLQSALVAACEAGRYRVRHDARLRPLLELGCQENVFEDVAHQVEHCGAPLQGRAYRTREAGGGVLHLATACFDADRALGVRLRASTGALGLPPHAERGAPLSVLGNFEHMFDSATRHAAERLYADDARLTRRVRELFKHERYPFAAQTLTSAALLAGGYFEARHARVAQFASNRVAVWRSVAEGNLQLVQRAVARLARRSRGRRHVELYAGTHGVLSLAAGPGAARRELFLSGGRFPVPRYVWTALVAPRENRGVALAVLNDPFVTVSELHGAGAELCGGTCDALPWLAELTRLRAHERPLAGLVSCCSLPDFADVVGEMPRIFNSTIQLLI